MLLLNIFNHCHNYMTDKLYHIIVVHLALIGIRTHVSGECICSCKSNYHAITINGLSSHPVQGEVYTIM
jgi:hypothetical protein